MNISSVIRARIPDKKVHYVRSSLSIYIIKKVLSSWSLSKDFPFLNSSLWKLTLVLSLWRSCAYKLESHEKTHFDKRTYELVISMNFRKSRLDLLILSKQKLVKNTTQPSNSSSINIRPETMQGCSVLEIIWIFVESKYNLSVLEMCNKLPKKRKSEGNFLFIVLFALEIKVCANLWAEFL